MKRTPWIPFISALLGGLLVVAVLAATGNLNGGQTTTVTTVQTPAPAAAANTAHVSGTLTPHEIYERNAPGVVFVTSTRVEKSESSGLFGSESEGSHEGVATGSGIVINRNGTILTNYHVIENSIKVTVSFEKGKTVEAKVVGKDPSDDLAVLRIPTDGLNLHVLTLGNSDNVQVGEPAYAIGNPFDLQRTMTAGIISALQRQIQSPNGFAIKDVLQTDAAINPGNSGGPLLNAYGQVIGIDSQIETGGSGDDGNIGIGFAIPINTAKGILGSLEKGGTITGPFLGVTTVSVGAGLQALNLPVKEGALIESVVKGSAAQKAGLKGGTVTSQTEGGAITIGGDIITGVDGKKVASSEELANLIGTKHVGETVTIKYLAPTGHGKYEEKTTTAKLGSRPASAPTGTQTPGG
ncbi:MAG TPA: trypsin-like peptidase domain-containing protein [Solirubrobacteraceae bacterium]|nr:trypsin-like peptidase domain-containing protein [Solirubrobacteraceae bacterium]